LVVFWTGVCIFFAFGDTTISFGFLSCWYKTKSV
jgi:hypothetical protein